MSKQHFKPQIHNAYDSIFLELVEYLICPESGKIWLQKIVNILKQYLNAKNLVLCTFIDNLNVFSADDVKFVDKILLTRISASNNLSANIKPYWSDENYIVPLLYDAQLIVNWNKKPEESELSLYNHLFLLLSSSLKNRADLLLRESNISCEESVLRIQKILGLTFDRENRGF